MKKRVGIIVGRFQVAELHEGHKYLIQTALDECEHVIIFLGSSEESFTEKNPLPFYHRKWMILETFKNKPLYIYGLPDIDGDDKSWVEDLDRRIHNSTMKTEHPVLYGSRDSFIETYDRIGGKYMTRTIHSHGSFSGTTHREHIKNVFFNSADFRKGIIYTVLNSKK